MIRLTYPRKLISKDNEKIFNRQGRPFLSKKYKQWEEEIRVFTIIQYKGKILEDDLRVEIKATFKDKRHIDMGNGSKSICDALQKIVYKNDKQIADLRIFREYGDKEEISVIIDEI